MYLYFLHILISLDQLGTTLVGGYPDETLSSYAYRLNLQGKRGGLIFMPLINWMFRNPNHCYLAYQEEVQNLQLPREFR
jgi:hypothetical protein